MATTAHITNINGLPVLISNTVIEGNGFYVSYNNHDIRIYGSDTTALVLSQGEHFYILNGNHMDNYRPLIPQGLNACIAYFRANKNVISKYSEII